MPMPTGWMTSSLTGGLMTGEDAVSVGLTGAAGLIQGGTANPYPAFVPSQTTAPSSGAYPNYTPNAPMAQVQTPNYSLNTAPVPTWNSLGSGGTQQPQQQAQYQPAQQSAGVPYGGQQQQQQPQYQAQPQQQPLNNGLMYGSQAPASNPKTFNANGYNTQIQKDFDNYFDTTKEGSVTPFASGYLTMGPGGVAAYTDANGRSVTKFSKDTPLQGIGVGNEDIAKAWSEKYGIKLSDLGQGAGGLQSTMYKSRDGYGYSPPATLAEYYAQSPGSQPPAASPATYGGATPQSAAGASGGIFPPGDNRNLITQAPGGSTAGGGVTPTAAPAYNWANTGNYGTVNTDVATTPWNYQGIGTNAQAAGYDWQNTQLAAGQNVQNPYAAYGQNANIQSAQINPQFQNTAMNQQTVNSQNAQAAGYNWQNTNLNGSNVNQNYQKLGGTTPSYQGVGTNAQAAGYNWQDAALNKGADINSQNASAAGYQFQNTNTQAANQGWNYQGINPNAQTAGYNWQNTGLNQQTVTNPYAAYGGADTAYQKLAGTPTFGNTQVSNPFQAYGGNPDIQAAQVNQQYQKMGAAPGYSGLVGQDYEALQKALTTPGEIAAKRAYEQGQTNLASTMGGKGLYGSSIMSNQARSALEQPYMDTLATNAAQAASQRYGMQATDLQNQNQFGLNVYGQQMGENTAAQAQAMQGALSNQADVQNRNALSQQQWQNRMAENLSGAQMGLEAQTSNQKNQQEMNTLQNSVYGQQQAENQAANQQAYNTWGARLGENQAGQQMGMQAQIANQNTNANLQGLMSQQGLAKNQAGLDYAKMGTDVNLANASNQLAQSQQANQLGASFAQSQNALAADAAARNLQQSLAGNAAGLDYAKLQTGVNQQNSANNLSAQQSNQANNMNYQQLVAQQGLAKNAAGMDYTKLATGVNQQNVANALAQSQNQNQFGLDVYGQRMAENQNANQFGQTQALANQANNMQLQGLLSQQGLAQNAAGLDYTKLQTGVNQQNAANNLTAQQSNQSANAQMQGLALQQGLASNQQNYNTAIANQGDIQNQNALAQQAWQSRMAENQAGQQMGLQTQQSNQAANMQMQGLLSAQGIAQNANALNYAGLQTGVNQQNTANALSQSSQANALGQNQAQFQTTNAQANSQRSWLQQSALNALQSGDMQSYNALMNQLNIAGINSQTQLGTAQIGANASMTNTNANIGSTQNLAQNQFGLDLYGMSNTQNQNMNTFNLGSAQLGMQQNQNVYQGGVGDAARQGDYNVNALNYGNGQTAATTAWSNGQSFEQFQYQLASGQYSQQEQTNGINQYLALAGRGQVTSGQNQQGDQYAAGNATASQNGWLGAAGTVVGGLMANNGAGAKQVWNAATGVYDWVMA